MSRVNGGRVLREKETRRWKEVKGCRGEPGKESAKNIPLSFASGGVHRIRRYGMDGIRKK